MKTLKYKVIKTKNQYRVYCILLEDLIDKKSKSKEQKDEIELLTLLIENWDKENNTFNDLDPIELLSYLMSERGLKPIDLVPILGVNKSLISEVLNYKKGISKKMIRILSEYFKVSQEMFNRPYILKSNSNSKLKNASVRNIEKELGKAG